MDVEKESWSNDVSAIFRRTGRLLRHNPPAVFWAIVGAVGSLIPVVGSFFVLLIMGGLVESYARSMGLTSRDRVAPTRVVSLVLGSLVVGVSVMIGLALLVVPGIYVAVRLSLTVPAIMVDSKGPLKGPIESWQRTRGNLLKVFGVNLVVGTPGVIALVPSVLDVPMSISIPVALVFYSLYLLCGAAASLVMYLTFESSTPSSSRTRTDSDTNFTRM